MGSTNVHRLSSFPPASAEADLATIRAAARQVASGVSVVTLGTDKARAGLTALSSSLLSPAPATLVLCVSRSSPGYPALARSARFAVNVLGGDQREIAEHFASPEDESGGCFEWLPLADGLAGLADCAAVFECEKDEIIERRAEAIVIGRVRRAMIGGGSGALVRWRGVYDQIGWSRDEIMRAVGLRP
jgi:flavin reductase (DIM6/NTAB) family NADH-FMN oxidoreductase RutF